MALPCSRRLLPTIVAQILQQLGWDAVHQSVMDVLVDILDRNLTTICRKVHFFAELDGRTVPDLDDLDMTFRDLGVNLHDLLDYVTEVEPSSLVIEVPQFPISAEKIKSQLNAEKNSAANKVKTRKPAEEQRPETEEGSQGVAPLGAASVTTPGTSAADVKPFTNESGTTKRPRLLPDEAMHSQYEMKSFLVSNSGCFIPVNPGIRASARCGSPTPPKRPVQRSPALPTYTFEAVNVIGESESKRTLDPEVRMLHMKHVKKSGKLPKDNLHKLLKHGVKKPKKISHGGPSGMNKLSKSLKLEKARLSKSKSSDKKLSVDLSVPQVYPGDPEICEDAPINRELQKSRIRSYEDSINTVVQYSSQDEVKFSPDELCMLPSVAGPNVLDNKSNPVDDFYLDLGSPPPPAAQLFDYHGTAERDAHINSTIDDVIKASLDDDLKMSPEPGESENETEPKQSAVEDIFDVSCVPSPKIPTTWQMVEEGVIEEPVEVPIGDSSILNALVERGSPTKKPKKLKAKALYKDGFDESSKKSDSQNKRTGRHLAEQPIFDDSSLGSWSGEDSERRSRDPLQLSAVLPEASVFPKNLDSWNKKSKSQTSKLSNVDSVYSHGGGNDRFERNFAQFTSDSDAPKLLIGADDVHKKRKHRHGNEDTTMTSHAERKKSKHASNRSAFSSAPEPPRTATDHSDEGFTSPQVGKQSQISEWPKVRLENVGFFDEKKPSKKRPFPYSPTAPSLHQSPESHLVSSKSLLPPSPPPPPPLPPVSDHLDTNSLPPLKRIKIVSSAGVVNQFEIKEPPQSSSMVEIDYKPDRKEKKKAKKSKDRERSRDRKDRSSNYEPRDNTTATHSRDWESHVSNKLDSKPGKISSGDKHHHRAVVQSPAEDLGWRSNDDHFGVSRGPTDLSDYRFLETSANEVEHRWKGNILAPRDEDLDRERSKSHKKKDRSKSRDEGKSGRKEDKRREQGEKSVEKSEHKKKKSERRRELEPVSEPLPIQLPSIPKLTLKFGGGSAGTPSLSRAGEPSIQPVSRITEPPTNPPIKLRFKTGFSSMPSAVSSPSVAGQLPYYDSTAGPSAKFAVQPWVNQSLLEVPSFSPSPESISIPSPNDSSDSKLSISGRERGPIPPSLPTPIVPLHRIPVYTSSSSASSRSPSPPPSLRLLKEVDGRLASFSASSRRSTPLPPVESAAVQIPKLEASSRVLKSAASSKGSSQKPKSSTRVASPPKVFPSHVKGLPPSKIMPLAVPALPLLPAPKASQSGAKSGNSKSKKRVTTETVSKVVNEDGVVTKWICPACLLEDKGEEPMIGCDGCDDWYHWRCVGVIVEPPKEIPWFCQRCQVKSKVLLKTPSSGRGKGKKSKRK